MLLSIKQIISVCRSTSCSSFRVALIYASKCNVAEGVDERGIEGRKENMLFHAAAFSGLPIAAGVVIRAGGRGRPYDAIVR